MADTRITTNAVVDPSTPGHFLITCDDGSQFTSRSFVDSPEGMCVVGSAIDGSVAADGPMLTDAVRAELEALGCEGIPLHTAAPKEHVTATTAVPDVPAVPAVPASHGADSPTPASPVIATEAHASKLEQIVARMRAGERWFVHEIAAAIHAV